MLILKGVMQSSGARALGVPVNPRTTLRLTRIQTETVRVCVTDEAGTAVDLSELTTTLTVKANSSCDERVLRKQVTGTREGHADFVIAVADTRNLESGRYVYDVWVSATGVQQPVIGLSPCILEPGAF